MNMWHHDLGHSVTEVLEGKIKDNTISMWIFLLIVQTLCYNGELIVYELIIYTYIYIHN